MCSTGAGKILAVRFARTMNVPFLGICLGMQVNEHMIHARLRLDPCWSAAFGRSWLIVDFAFARVGLFAFLCSAAVLIARSLIAPYRLVMLWAGGSHRVRSQRLGPARCQQLGVR